VFSLYQKESRIPRLLVAYVWHAKDPEASEVYALTYDEALRIVKSKPYFSSKSWIDEGGYSVTHAGAELKAMLKEYRMTPKKWRQRLESI
jgi:N-acetylglutamate synthase-like GNAT family acetyltransferase